MPCIIHTRTPKHYPRSSPFVNRKNYFYNTLIFPYLLFRTRSYFVRIECILTIFIPQNNHKNRVFYSRKHTRNLCIVFFTITICKKRQIHSINNPRNNPHKGKMSIIGNYTEKMRFLAQKPPKRAAPHFFLLPLLSKPQFCPNYSFLAQKQMFLHHFMPFLVVFGSFLTDFTLFSLFCLLLSLISPAGCINRLSTYFYIYIPILTASQLPFALYTVFLSSPSSSSVVLFIYRFHLI